MRGSEKWIKLETVNGIPVTGDEFVASWVVNSTVVVTTPPTEEPPVSDPFVKAQLLNKDGVVVEEYTMVKL
jgi:propanediol dehydratase large subunit